MKLSMTDICSLRDNANELMQRLHSAYEDRNTGSFIQASGDVELSQAKAVLVLTLMEIRPKNPPPKLPDKPGWWRQGKRVVLVNCQDGSYRYSDYRLSVFNVQVGLLHGDWEFITEAE